MPIVTQVVCGGCGAVRRQTNHWFVVAIVEQSLLVRPLDVALAQRGVDPSPGSEEYYCGQQCALGAVGQWMQDLQLIAPD
jgi:hypothetical protein